MSASQAAYQRAIKAAEEAHAQGLRKEPLSGDPLLFSTVSDSHMKAGIGKVNVFREKYERGLNGLLLRKWPDEFAKEVLSKTDASGVSHG